MTFQINSQFMFDFAWLFFLFLTPFPQYRSMRILCCFFFASNFNVGSKIEMKYAPFYFRNMACNMNSGIFTRAHLFQCAHTCYNVANKQTNEKRMKKKLFSFGHFHLRNCIENNVDVSFPTSDCFCLSGQYFRWIFVYEMEWIAWNWWWDIATPTNISNNTNKKPKRTNENWD